MILKLVLLIFFIIMTIGNVRPDDLYEVMRAYWSTSPVHQPCEQRETMYAHEQDDQEYYDERDNSWELGTNDSNTPTEVIINPYQ